MHKGWPLGSPLGCPSGDSTSSAAAPPRPHMTRMPVVPTMVAHSLCQTSPLRAPVAEYILRGRWTVVAKFLGLGAHLLSGVDPERGAGGRGFWLGRTGDATWLSLSVVWCDAAPCGPPPGSWCGWCPGERKVEGEEDLSSPGAGPGSINSITA